MTKLYYIDPLQAAYMAREFGIKFAEDYALSWTCEGGKEYVKMPHMFQGVIDKYYIHPDSYHIFVPQVGDLITTKYDAGAIKIIEYDTSHKYVYEQVTEIERIENFIGKDELKIIQRDNKLFFWSEEEEVKD